MYIIPFGLLLIMSAFNKKISKKTFLISSAVILAIVSFLRFGVGADYFSYEYLYNELDVKSIGSMLDSLVFIEFGFRALMYISKIVGLSYHTFASIISIAIVILTLAWINDNSENYQLSTLLFYTLFYFVWAISALRQGLALILAMYLLFNNKYFFKMYQKVLILLACASLHVSVLILLPIILLRDYTPSKKTLMILFGISLVITFIPFGSILGALSSIPYIGKLTHYLEGSGRGFLDFPGIVRILFFIGIWLHYDKLIESKNKSIRDLTLLSLYSFIIYFVFKFSELMAARFSVFGYFSVIIIFPSIVMLYEKRQLRMMGMAGLMTFSSLSLYKEMKTVIDQSGFRGGLVELNKNTILNADRGKFFNQYNLIAQRIELCKANEKEFFGKFESDAIPYADKNNLGDHFQSVFFPDTNLYGIINDKGEIVERGIYRYRPEIYGDIVVEETEGTSFKRFVLKNIRTGEYVPEDQLSATIDNFTEETKMRTKWIDFDHYTYEQMKGSLFAELIPEEDILTSSIGKYGSPFFYEIVEVTAYTQTMYIYLDDYYNPLNNSIYYSITPYGSNFIAIGKTSCSSEYINRNGDIIWIEKEQK